MKKVRTIKGSKSILLKKLSSIRTSNNFGGKLKFFSKPALGRIKDRQNSKINKKTTPKT
jgi:hypothetical protein